VRRTNPIHLILLAVAGAAVGWLVETALASAGRAVAVPPITLAIGLVVIAVSVVVAAIPVRRVARGRRGAKVDPHYATRVVVLAKAASITGAILTGAGAGVLAFLLTRPVIAVGSVWPAVLAAIAAVAVLAAGLIAENMCRIPPERDGDGGRDHGGQAD